MILKSHNNETNMSINNRNHFNHCGYCRVNLKNMKNINEYTIYTPHTKVVTNSMKSAEITYQDFVSAVSGSNTSFVKLIRNGLLQKQYSCKDKRHYTGEEMRNKISETLNQNA